MPCKNAAILGATVCIRHGGNLKMVKAAARRRLMLLIEPSIEALLRALGSGDPCNTCGRSDDMNVVVRAATAVLDRCGFGPNIKLDVEIEDKNETAWVAYLNPNEVRVLTDLMRTARSRMGTSAAIDVEGVTVEDPNGGGSGVDDLTLDDLICADAFDAEDLPGPKAE